MGGGGINFALTQKIDNGEMYSPNTWKGLIFAVLEPVNDWQADNVNLDCLHPFMLYSVFSFGMSLIFKCAVYLHGCILCDRFYRNPS